MGSLLKWNLINWRGRKVFPLRGDEMGGPIRKCDVLHNNFGTKAFVILSLFFFTPFPQDLSHFRKNVTFNVLALL